MMKKSNYVVIFLFLFLWSCASTMNYTWTKEGFEGKHYEKILILAISKNLEARAVFENTVVEKLKEKGINAENSLGLFPPIKDINELSEEEIEARIKKGNYDAIFVSSLVDINTQEVYESGTDYYYPVNYQYRRHIYTGYQYVHSPDYYRTQQTYVLETRLFDAGASTKEDAIVWSGQSSLTDPVSYESGSRQYAKELVNSLMESQIIK